MSSRLLQEALRPEIASAVLRKLNLLAPMTADEQTFLRGLEGRREIHAPGASLWHEGDTGSRPRFIVSGWASRQRLLPDGRRQIFAILLPGDLIGVCAEPRPLALTTTVAATQVVSLDGATLVSAARRSDLYPNIGRAMEAAILQEEEALLLDQVVRLGRQTAYERVAHLLLELRSRLAAVGLGDERRFPLPLTQETLSNVLGLSIVHVNRTLQQLRRERLIEMSSSQVLVLEPERLIAISDYKPAAPFPF